MSKKTEIVDGELKITDTPDSIISTMTRKEVEGKKAEAQTVVDHKTIDLAEAVTERDKWDDYLKEIDK